MGINELLRNAGSRGGGNELVSCPGEEVIHPITSCYEKWCKFPHCGSVLAQVLTLLQIYKLFLCVMVVVCSLADIEDGADLLRTTDGQEAIKHCPSLHTMAELFLQNGTKQLFKVIVLLML